MKLWEEFRGPSALVDALDFIVQLRLRGEVEDIDMHRVYKRNSIMVCWVQQSRRHAVTR
jgi:hypothetical protein